MESPAAIVVVGASAGGVDAIRTLVGGLPRSLDAAVFVVLHIGAHKSNLPWLLSRAGPLPAAHPFDGEAIGAGRIYVAPPDHHMLVERGRISLTKGPRENWARPAIDPLFRSAARAYKKDVIGVVLTGGLNDGTAGLFEVKSNGGLAIVQDPTDAASDSMPRSAIANVDIDHMVPVSDIARLVGAAIDTRSSRAAPSQPVLEVEPLMELEMTAQFTLDKPLTVTCPDCGGALRRTELGSLTQFNCHIGHVYTAEVMLAAQFLAMERFLEQAMRSLNERAELCRGMAVKAIGPERAAWESAEREALDQTAPIRSLLTREWLHPGGDGVIEASSP